MRFSFLLLTLLVSSLVSSGSSFFQLRALLKYKHIRSDSFVILFTVPGKWKQKAPPKRHYLNTSFHGVMSHDSGLLIRTALRSPQVRGRQLLQGHTAQSAAHQLRYCQAPCNLSQHVKIMCVRACVCVCGRAGYISGKDCDIYWPISSTG